MQLNELMDTTSSTGIIIKRVNEFVNEQQQAMSEILDAKEVGNINKIKQHLQDMAEDAQYRSAGMDAVVQYEKMVYDFFSKLRQKHNIR